MTALKSVLFGTAIGLLSAVGANAADLTPPLPSPTYIPPPTFTWAGAYLGITAGYANGFHTSTTSPVRFWAILAFQVIKAMALPGAAHLDLTCRQEA